MNSMGGGQGNGQSEVFTFASAGTWHFLFLVWGNEPETPAKRCVIQRGCEGVNSLLIMMKAMMKKTLWCR